MALKFTTDYVRKLIVERHHIRAALTNPGGSVILTASALVDADRSEAYTSSIGSVFHHDLIETEAMLKELVESKTISKDELAALMMWFDSLDSLQASQFLSAKPATVRKRQSRGLGKLVKALNGEDKEPGKTREDSDIPADARGAEAWFDTIQDEHHRLQAETQDQQKRTYRTAGASQDGRETHQRPSSQVRREQR